MRESNDVPRVAESIRELVGAGDWGELSDRFFRRLAFGTGGLRGRTIGKVVTKAEMGKPTALGRPEFPAVGTNCMNEGNVARATQGLVNYLKKNFPGQAPRVVFAHDTRFFSREFAELAARTVAAAYGEQLDEIGGADPELADAIADFRADEVEHKATAMAAGAERAPAYPLMTAAIRLGCRVAIAASKRI